MESGSLLQASGAGRHRHESTLVENLRRYHKDTSLWRELRAISNEEKRNSQNQLF